MTVLPIFDSSRTISHVYVSYDLFYSFQDAKSRIIPFLGKWKGHSITKRSGVYGSTIANADTVVLHDMDDNGQLMQVFYNLVTQVT